MRPGAVLFDLDDTLLDWPAAIDATIGPSLAVAGLPDEPLARDSLWDEIRAFTWHARDGRVVDRAHWRLLFEPQLPWERAFPLEPRTRITGGARAFAAALDPRPFAGTVSVLDELGAICRLGILSNSPKAKYTLEKLGLLGRFAAVVSADDPYRKPHRAAFEQACFAVGVSAAEAVYVGDSFANDVEGAVGAGLRAVWVDRWGDGHRLPAGVARIEVIGELPAALSTLS